MTDEILIFDEYRAAVEWCAKRWLTGADGDPLPSMLSSRALAAINDDPDAFRDEVRLAAYAMAMERTERRFREVRP